MKIVRTAALAVVLALPACAPTYSLVPTASVSAAKGAMHVRPATSWNRAPKAPTDIKWEENWTRNGPLLDSIGFIGGLPDGQAITRQRRKDDQKVPVFRADMTPQDLVSMVESYYRIKANASVFETMGVEPVTFLGKPGLRFNYSYVGGDEVKRKGRTVASIVDGKLYLMALDGTALHYFDAAAPDFDAMVAGATLN